MGKVRPNPARWVWYAYGGRLPERYRDWVLHDVTCRTWALRHLVRSLVQLTPGLLFLLVPGPMWIKAMPLLGCVLIALWCSAAYLEHTSEHRLAKYGFSLGTGRATREEGGGPRLERASFGHPCARGRMAAARRGRLAGPGSMFGLRSELPGPMGDCGYPQSNGDFAVQ